jgi:hypothetical protein
MLGPVGVADQFRELESQLPADWADARLVLEVEDAARVERAAALLAPLGPARSGRRVQLTISRRGATVDRLRRLLQRIDADGIRGWLDLVTHSTSVAAAPDASAAWPPLEQAWLAEAAALPEDWSDLYAEVELASSDFLDAGALNLSPLNPSRPDRGLALKFRVSRQGYGGSADMARRCLARLDEAGINGRLRVLWAFSDTRPVLTQGPVRYTDHGPT